MHKEIHPIQGTLLRSLLLQETARFSVLKPDDLSSDHFTFHLKQLIELGVVEKRDDGAYQLTPSGKEYANRFDTDSITVKTEKQAKLTVLVMPFRDREGKREYVMQERLKHPFFGFKGFITGKIKLGESVVTAAERELEEETGLTGTLKHNYIYHERIYSTQHELLEDKYLFICTASVTGGELITEFEGGRNAWTPEEDVQKGNVFYDIADLFALVQKGEPGFSEHSYVVEKY